MALNLKTAARRNATSTIETGTRLTKEELSGEWLTIAEVGLVDKDKVSRGKPVVDENGEVVRLTWAQFRFKEHPGAYFRGFTALTNMVKEWTEEASLEEINAELAANPMRIRIHPAGGASNAWLFDIE